MPFPFGRLASLLATAGALALSAPTAALASAPAPGFGLKRSPFPDALVGRWEGTGWIALDGPKQLFNQSERIRWVAGGTVLLFEGRGTGAIKGSGEDPEAHESLGVLAYDHPKKQPRFSAYRGDGGFIDMVPVLTERSLGWTYEEGGRQFRFTISLSPAGRWHEIGEVSADGVAWKTIFGMDLARVP